MCSSGPEHHHDLHGGPAQHRPGHSLRAHFVMRRSPPPQVTNMSNFAEWNTQIQQTGQWQWAHAVLFFCCRSPAVCCGGRRPAFPLRREEGWDKTKSALTQTDTAPLKVFLLLVWLREALFPEGFWTKLKDFERRKRFSCGWTWRRLCVKGRDRMVEDVLSACAGRSTQFDRCASIFTKKARIFTVWMSNSIDCAAFVATYLCDINCSSQNYLHVVQKALQKILQTL